MVETTKMSASEVAAEHATESHAPYLKVWAGLAILTLVEYYYASIFKSQFLILLLGLLFLAVVKAGMVGWYFMHLKFEGKWKYLLLSPTIILAMGLPLALLPDIGVHYYTTDFAQTTAKISQEAPGVSEKTAAEHPREFKP